MSTAVYGILFALAVLAAVYFLFVVPGERRYHETKLKLMQERIERREKAHGSGQSSDDADPPAAA